MNRIYEMELLEDNNGIKICSFGFPSTKLTWKGAKVELQEQILSWGSA